MAIFHGLLSDEGNHFLLQEYGVRGSLEDILSSKIQLTWEVKRSLVNDIVDGMGGLNINFRSYITFLKMILKRRLNSSIKKWNIVEVFFRLLIRGFEAISSEIQNLPQPKPLKHN